MRPSAKFEILRNYGDFLSFEAERSESIQYYCIPHEIENYKNVKETNHRNVCGRM